MFYAFLTDYLPPGGSNKYPLRCHLDEMVDHEGANASSPPLRMDQQKGDVGLVVFHIWHHETEANHNLFVEDDHAEVRVLQTLGQVHTWTRTTQNK